MEVSGFEIWAYRAIIGGACVIMWFFFQKLIKSIDKLNATIQEMSGTIRVDQARCEEKHIGISLRLNDLTDKEKTLIEQYNKLDKDLSLLKNNCLNCSKNG